MVHELSLITIFLSLIGIGFFIPSVRNELLEYYASKNEEMLERFQKLEQEIIELQKVRID